jgi:hypothetical protein
VQLVKVAKVKLSLMHPSHFETSIVHPLQKDMATVQHEEAPTNINPFMQLLQTLMEEHVAQLAIVSVQSWH